MNKKIIQLGKIDYYHTGRALNPVDVEIEYRDNQKHEGEKELSICGYIWNRNRSDVLCGGQCLDEIAKYINTSLFKEIYRLWDLYHLNGMHPECEHQAVLGWKDIAEKKVKLYEFTLTAKAICAQNEIKKAVLSAAKNEKVEVLPQIERLILSLNYSVKTYKDILSDEIALYYKLERIEEKMLGWLEEKEHPDGILCRPCPVCGYKYGTAWNYFPIPEEDEKIIYKLLKGDMVNDKIM